MIKKQSRKLFQENENKNTASIPKLVGYRKYSPKKESSSNKNLPSGDKHLPTMHEALSSIPSTEEKGGGGGGGLGGNEGKESKGRGRRRGRITH